MTPETSRVEVDGVSIHVEVQGTGPAIVLDSAGAPTDWFAAVVADLSVDHTTVGFDYRPSPGAASGLPRFAPWPEMAEHTIAVLDHLGIARAAIEGVSGGALSAGFAVARHPERFDRLVMANPAPPSYAPSDDPRQRVLDDPDYTRSLAGDVLFEELCAAVFSPEFAREHRELCRSLLLPDPLPTVLRAPYPDQPSFTEGPAIAVPTLILVGSDDVATPPAYGAAHLATIPGARMVELPGATHALVVEDAVRHGEVLRPFLAA